MGESFGDIFHLTTNATCNPKWGGSIMVVPRGLPVLSVRNTEIYSCQFVSCCWPLYAKDLFYVLYYLTSDKKTLIKKVMNGFRVIL